MYYKLKQNGQSLLEITITLGVALMVMIALTITTIQGLQSSQYSQNLLQATKFAQEGLERVRFLKAKNIPLKVNSVNYYWYSTTPLVWDLSFGSEEEDLKFIPDGCTTTTCTLESVSGNTYESLLSGQFQRKIVVSDESLGSKKFTSIVSWNDASGPHESKIVTIISK